jgi:metallo-beta-lactamase class B
MQDLGSRVVMGDADWASIEKSVNGYPEGKPKRDITATDGQVITVGNNSVTIVTTPGHTPGTLSFIFQVQDRGVAKTVAYSGGTAFNFVTTIPNFETYIASQRKMAAAAKAANATILMSNHSEFDNATTKIKLIGTGRPGDAHPFELGADAVQRYFKVSDECAQASVARLRMTPGK